MAAGVAPDGPAPPPRAAGGLAPGARGAAPGPGRAPARQLEGEHGAGPAPVHGGSTALLRRSPDGALRRSTA